MSYVIMLLERLLTLSQNAATFFSRALLEVESARALICVYCLFPRSLGCEETILQ